jgi:transposase-like protein
MARRPRDGHPWTDTERQSLRVARADDLLSLEDIADLLRRSLSQVETEIGRMGLPRKKRVRDGRTVTERKWTDEERDRLTRLWPQHGMTRSELAQLFGRSLASIEQMAVRLELPNRAPPRKRPVPVPARLDNAALIAELIRRGINPETARMVR